VKPLPGALIYSILRQRSKTRKKGNKIVGRTTRKNNRKHGSRERQVEVSQITQNMEINTRKNITNLTVSPMIRYNIRNPEDRKPRKTGVSRKDETSYFQETAKKSYSSQRKIVQKTSFWRFPYYTQYNRKSGIFG